jgi:hypothetical protein
MLRMSPTCSETNLKSPYTSLSTDVFHRCSAYQAQPMCGDCLNIHSTLDYPGQWWGWKSRLVENQVKTNFIKNTVLHVPS